MNIGVKKYLLQMLNQFIPVILGVYLGIVASNWNESRVKRAEQQEFISNLHQELEANKSKIESTLKYRQGILNESRQLAGSLSSDTLEANFWAMGGFSLIPSWQGTNIPTLERSVYQTGLATNLMNGLEFAIINTVARTYNYQDSYNSFAQKLIFDKIINLEDRIKTRQVLNKFEAWYDVAITEEALVEQYNNALSHLDTLQHD